MTALPGLQDLASLLHTPIDGSEYLNLDGGVDSLKAAEEQIDAARAVSLLVCFNPLAGAGMPAEEAERELRARGFVLWGLRDQQRIETHGGDQREGFISAARAFYLAREMVHEESDDRGYEQLIRDACVMGSLCFWEPARAAMRQALKMAPQSHLNVVSAALEEAGREPSAYREETVRERLLRRPKRLRRRLARVSRPRLGVLRQHAPTDVAVLANRPSRRRRRELPSISLVTPSLNQGEFIGATMRSVADQGYPHLEHVVRDGGSRDSTLEVLSQFNGGMRWRSESDGGQASALNAGFADTSGEVMGWLNSDDVLMPGALATVGAFFAANPGVEVVYGHRVLIDPEGRQIGMWVMPPHRREAFLWADWVPQETLFFRRSAWERIGAGLREDLHFALDWELLLRLDEAGARMERLPRVLGGFRVHERQKTQALGSSLYWAERDQLMNRFHGRSVSQQEAMERSAAYLRRHVLHHVLYRARQRMLG